MRHQIDLLLHSTTRHPHHTLRDRAPEFFAPEIVPKPWRNRIPQPGHQHQADYPLSFVL